MLPMSLLCIAWKKSLIYAQLSTLAWAACGVNKPYIEKNKVKEYDIIFVDATKFFKQLKLNGKVEKHT